MNDAPIEQTFDTRAAYLAALDTVIAAARRQLRVFDTDLRQADFDAPRRSEALAAFLAGGRERNLRIVLHDVDHLDRYCPRFGLLLRRFSHAVQVRQTPERLRHLADCFALADDAGAAIRFHADHFRGKLLLDHADAALGWGGRFEDLWLESTPALAPTRLGL